MASYTVTTASMRAAVKAYMEGYCTAMQECYGMASDSTVMDAAEKAAEKYAVTFDTAMSCYEDRA